MKKIKDLENGKILYKSHRAEPYFGFVKDGTKTIEGRINKNLYKELKSGDEILVFNNDETNSVQVQVKDIRTYSSFLEMLEKENFKKILPDTNSASEGVKIYKRFYTPEQEKQFGVIAIKISVKKQNKKSRY